MATALVTGANRGLGFETARQLVKLGWQVLVTARDEAQARIAATKLGAGATPAVLDVEQPASISEFVQGFGNEPAFDALVNNAGASFEGFDEEVARRTLEINYRGPVRVSDALLRVLAPSANIVMVSSGMGSLRHVASALRERLLSANISRADLEELAVTFVRRVALREPDPNGFPDNAYSVSKILLNAFTRILARELAGSQRRVNAVCPGWVRTRMGGESAPRSVEQGAEIIVQAATFDERGPTGQFLRDGHPIPW